MHLFKVGGSCLSNSVDHIVSRITKAIHKDEAPDKTCVIVHGYSRTLGKILKTHGIERPAFVTASGKSSRFTTYPALAASHLAAILTRQQLISSLGVHFASVLGVLGYQGCLLGRRKSKIRYKENGVLKVFKDDCSGRIDQIRKGWWMKQDIQPNSVFVLTPLLADMNGGILVCDADHVAAQVAVHSGLSHYTILSDTAGFKVHGKVITKVPESRIGEYQKHASGGMVKKIHYIAQALKQGVQQVHLLSGMAADAETSKGTLFYADSPLPH